jgi:hypothetical protein
MVLGMLWWRRRKSGYDPHTSDSEAMRRWAVERDAVNARLLREWAEQRRQARRQALCDAVRAGAFFLVSAAIAATMAGVIDNAGRGGDSHGREIMWWLTIHPLPSEGTTPTE